MPETSTSTKDKFILSQSFVAFDPQSLGPFALSPVVEWQSMVCTHVWPACEVKGGGRG